MGKHKNKNKQKQTKKKARNTRKDKGKVKKVRVTRKNPNKRNKKLILQGGSIPFLNSIRNVISSMQNRIMGVISNNTVEVPPKIEDTLQKPSFRYVKDDAVIKELNALSDQIKSNMDPVDNGSQAKLDPLPYNEEIQPVTHTHTHHLPNGVTHHHNDFIQA